MSDNGNSPPRKRKRLAEQQTQALPCVDDVDSRDVLPDLEEDGVSENVADRSADSTIVLSSDSSIVAETVVLSESGDDTLNSAIELLDSSEADNDLLETDSENSLPLSDADLRADREALQNGGPADLRDFVDGDMQVLANYGYETDSSYVPSDVSDAED
ncbi:hypothetical protein AAVH_18166 [Aphelenchoides avenae]|nr:hypothetical protein AAVH_18166 [Aphelenchus avenae]